MSSRYLIPLAVAAALAAPVAANAQEGTYDPGKWLVRVGMSQINPDSYNLKLSDSAAVVVDSDISATATIEYMVTPHIGTELLVAWPFTHGLDLDTGSRPLDRVAHVDVMPPTLSLNYHFNPNGMFRPYIGAGMNWTLFSGEETTGALDGLNLKLEDSFGVAGQVGVDIGQRNWFFNANVRYIDMSTDVQLNGAELGTADLNPWIYGLH
ncbi:MAG: OmpW family outer membrane protein, partial [Steroidobacteraceae bacterium]